MVTVSRSKNVASAGGEFGLDFLWSVGGDSECSFLLRLEEVGPEVLAVMRLRTRGS